MLRAIEYVGATCYPKQSALLADQQGDHALWKSDCMVYVFRTLTGDLGAIASV